MSAGEAATSIRKTTFHGHKSNYLLFHVYRFNSDFFSSRRMTPRKSRQHCVLWSAKHKIKHNSEVFNLARQRFSLKSFSPFPTQKAKARACNLGVKRNCESFSITPITCLNKFDFARLFILWGFWADRGWRQNFRLLRRVEVEHNEISWMPTYLDGWVRDWMANVKLCEKVFSFEAGGYSVRLKVNIRDFKQDKSWFSRLSKVDKIWLQNCLTLDI